MYAYRDVKFSIEYPTGVTLLCSRKVCGVKLERNGIFIRAHRGTSEEIPNIAIYSRAEKLEPRNAFPHAQTSRKKNGELYLRGELAAIDPRRGSISDS